MFARKFGIGNIIIELNKWLIEQGADPNVVAALLFGGIAAIAIAYYVIRRLIRGYMYNKRKDRDRWPL
jgi:hypothetical protein